MKLITCIYYRCYDAQRLVGNEDVAKYTALLMMTAATQCLIIDLLILFNLVFNTSIFYDVRIAFLDYIFSGKELTILNMFIVFFILCIIIFRKNRFEKIIKENEDESKAQKNKKGVITYFLFFAIIISVPAIMIIISIFSQPG